MPILPKNIMQIPDKAYFSTKPEYLLEQQKLTLLVAVAVGDVSRGMLFPIVVSARSLFFCPPWDPTGSTERPFRSHG